MQKKTNNDICKHCKIGYVTFKKDEITNMVFGQCNACKYTYIESQDNALTTERHHDPDYKESADD